MVAWPGKFHRPRVSATCTALAVVDSSLSRRGLRPDLIAMKNKNPQRQNLNQARRTA